MKAIKLIIKTIIPIALIVLAVVIGNIIIKTTKKPEKKRPQRTAYAAEVVSVASSSQKVTIMATGTVIPATQITLRSRVTGEIVDISPEFIDGGMFKTDEVILKIDPTDYKLAIEQKKAALAEAEYQLKLEQGQSDIAAREWELMSSGADESQTDRDLAMRVPHLKYRQAKVDAAKAELDKANLDLSRTEIRAPFNAVVSERKSNLGTQATTQDSLATLAGADRFYVRASVPVDQLKWIKCDPNNGSIVSIVRGTGAIRQGRAIRLESSLEQMGRMARVLIAVDKPMDGGHPMLLNEYVNIEIQGTTIDNAYRIPRIALHDDKIVWLATPESTLEIREVEVVWRDASNVIVSGGLKDGERVIMTNLSTPLNGMDLRIAGDAPTNKKPQKNMGNQKTKGPKHNE